MESVGISIILFVLVLSFFFFIKKDLTSLIILHFVAITSHTFIWVQSLQYSDWSFLSSWKEIILLLVILLSLNLDKGKKNNNHFTKYDHVDWVIIIYILFSAIYVFKSPIFKVGLYGFILNCSCAIVYLTIRCVNNKYVKIDKILNSILFISIIPALLSIVETFYLNKILFITAVAADAEGAFYREATSLTRAGSIFGEFLPNAFFLLIPMSISLTKYIMKKSTINFSIMVFFFMAFLTTQTRSVFLFFIVSLLIAFVKFIYNRTYRKIYILLMFFVVIFFASTLFQLFYTFDEGSSAVRFIAWDKSFEYILKYPWGLGLGTCGVISDNFQNILPEGRINNESWFFQITIELGYLGVSIFFVMLSLIFRELFKGLQFVNGNSQNTVILISWLMLVTLSLSGLVLHSWAYVATIPTWIFIAFSKNIIDEYKAKI